MLSTAPKEIVDKYLVTIDDEYPAVVMTSWKLLDAIHRQSLMLSADAEYKYDIDEPKRDLANPNLLPRERYAKLRRYVADWEEKTDIEFSLAEVKISETDLDAEGVADYENIRKALVHLKDAGNSFLEPDVLIPFLNKLQKTLVDSLASAQGAARNHHLQFDRETQEAQFNVDAVPYFSRYIGFAMGIFMPYLIKKSGKRNFAALMSLKIGFEHRAHEQAERLSADKIRDRIKGAKSLYNRLAKEPAKLGLISEDFIDYLIEREGDPT